MTATTEQIQSIEQEFARRFAHWGIQLPPGSAGRREGGHIFEQGWHVGYVWGEEDGEEYLEVLSQHRMADDARVRLWASGHSESLPAPKGYTRLPAGVTPAERARLEAETAERYRALSRDLRARGLLPPGGRNLPAQELNEFLNSGGMADKESLPYDFWPPELTDPETGERLTSMHLSSPGPHARPIGYYEYDEHMELTCWKCGWRGTASEGDREDHEELFDVSCPRCEKMLLIVTVSVGLEETEAYAAAGNPKAQSMLKEFEEADARVREKLALKRADQLPDLPGEELAFTWDEPELQPKQRYLQISLGDFIVWKELAPLDERERFTEIKALFGQRYGRRFQSLTPPRDSKLWLLKDDAAAP